MPPCQGGDRRFESDRGRQNPLLYDNPPMPVGFLLSHVISRGASRGRTEMRVTEPVDLNAFDAWAKIRDRRAIGAKLVSGAARFRPCHSTRHPRAVRRRYAHLARATPAPSYQRPRQSLELQDACGGSGALASRGRQVQTVRLRPHRRRASCKSPNSRGQTGSLEPSDGRSSSMWCFTTCSTGARLPRR